MSFSREKRFFNKMFLILSKKHRNKLPLFRYFYKKHWSVFDYSLSMPQYKRVRLFNRPYIKHLHDIMHFRVYYGDYSIIKFRRYFKRLNKRRIDYESRLLFLLESRLDILLYRLNFFKHPRESRIFVLNKNILINYRLVSTLNYHLSIHEVVSLKKKYKKIFYKKVIQKLRNEDILFNNPKYIEINYRLLKWFFVSPPKLEEITIPRIWEFNFTFLRGSLKRNM